MGYMDTTYIPLTSQKREINGVKLGLIGDSFKLQAIRVLDYARM